MSGFSLPGLKFTVPMSEPNAIPSSTDYQQLIQSLPNCILLHDARTKNILWANQAACDMLDFTLEELKPLKAPDMSSPDHRYRRSVGVQWLQSAVDEGVSGTEWMYRTKRGRNILTEAIATRVELESGTAIMVQFRNIEKEELLKTDLQKSKRRLDAFLQHMAEGILVLDEDTGISFASESAASHLGRSVDELLGSRFTDLCTVESSAALERTVANELTDGVSRGVRLQLERPEGDLRWYGASCQHIELEADLTGTLLLFHDMTDQIEAEEEHRRDVEHLNYLGRFNAMGDMAMAIAHELGQPLAAATNFVDGVSRRLKKPELDTTDLVYGLDNARMQIDRASQIIKSLREYVVQLEQSEQVVDLNEILDDCFYFIRLRAEQHETELQLVKSDEPIWIRCEKVLTGQVILNLCHNAIDEMSEWPQKERHVTISTHATKDTGVFRVADRGKGLAHIPNGRVFDGAFTSKSTGSGIGLALSHRIITRQHGTIHAEENRSSGSTFTFELPLA